MTDPVIERHIAVTGANGFLGSAVVAELLKHGASVRALYGPPGACQSHLLPESRIIHADICDPGALAWLLRGTHTVIHMAGPPSVRRSFDYPAEYMRAHAGGTACLLKACVSAKVRRFVYISSAEVYARTDSEFVSEDSRTEARSPYGAAKIRAEELIARYRKNFGLETVVLRPFSIYGPGASSESVLSKIIGMARTGGQVALNDLRPVRDYCFVSDVAQALVRCCNAPVDGEVFNVGTMRGTSILELAQLVLRSLRIQAGINTNGTDARPATSDVLHLIADNRRLVSQLDWSPKYRLEDGLRRILEAA